jgi:hypothetical protein
MFNDMDIIKKIIVAAAAFVGIVGTALLLAPHSKAQPQPGDPGWYGNNGPCNSNIHYGKWSSDGRVMITIWGPQGCDPSLPMTGTN